MKQILQAKVNLLIEKNRLEIEEKEKEKKSKSKLKAKNSFSHYEEPSKNVKFQTRGGRAQRVGEKMKAKTINKQEEQCQKAQTFQKRFQEVEREKNKEISLEELQKQQYYLQQILNNLNLKVNRLTLKIVKENLNNHKILKKTKTNPNLRTISRNLTENGTQTPIIYAYQQQNNNDQTSLLQTPQNSNYSKLDHETELNQSRMSQLSVQYTHLQSELLKYIKKGKDQQNDNLDLQSSQLIFNKQIHELEVLIRNRKKSIKELKKFLNKIPEHERKDCEPDKNEEVRGQIDYKSLRAQIYKRTLANEQKKQHLQELQQQEGKSIINIQGLQKTRLLFEQQLSSKDQKDKQFPQPTLSVNPPPSPSPSKLKHKTTLSVNNALSPQQLQQKYDYLLRKKQILQRSRESQLAKWRQIYKQKMRKLVSEYSHISQIHGMALKLETNKHMREQEIEEYQTRSNLGWSSLY